MTTINNVLQKANVEQLISIFDKVKRGVGLTVLENSFLTFCIKGASPLSAWVWSWVIPIPGSIQAIDSLTDRILKKEVPVARVFSEAEQTIRSYQEPSTSETAALAKLINSCLSREDIFTSVLSKFRTENGRDPKRGELITLVAAYNKSVLPQVEYAGQSLVEVPYFNESLEKYGTLTVGYHAKRYLEITEGSVAPLDVRYEQVLTQAQLMDIRSLYESLSQDTPYNNLGEMLEFIKFFNEQKRIKPDLTLKQAFDSYHPDLAEIFDKYHSGTCILLSAKLCKELSKKGIEAQILSTMSRSPWTSLPIPGKEVEIKWEALRRKLKGVEHADAACFFRREDGKESILRFQCSFEKDTEDEVCDYRSTREHSALSKLMFDIGDNEFPNRVLDSGEIGKTRLLGRYKVVMKKDEMILGVDFLRGNLYFRPSPVSVIGSESLKGLPLNGMKKVSITLADLANPEGRDFYFIDGVRSILSHRDALRLILERAGREVHLPSDIEENLIALAQNVPELFNDFFIEPLPLMKKTFLDLVAIDKRLKDLEGKISADDLGKLQDNYEVEVLTAICLNEKDAPERIKQFRDKIENLKGV